MSIFTIIKLVFAFSAVVPQVTAVVARAPYTHLLAPRQSSCTSACATFQNAANTCTTLACLCNSQVASGLQSCINCAVAANPSSDTISTAQQLASTYAGSCAGYSIPRITVPNPQPPAPQPDPTPAKPVSTPPPAPANPAPTPVTPITTPTPVVDTPAPNTPAAAPTTTVVVTTATQTTPAVGGTVTSAVINTQTVVRPGPQTTSGGTDVPSQSAASVTMSSRFAFGSAAALALAFGTVLAL
ncbi:hypothetical protein CPB83DRAFT_882018 [Crepidotus variabilis]|uniref:Extracellular membrane protein CFEM domain-containing protein n=1 Tax=Crepidotus variabilis TaxID=179855 RepID=A0A9P6JSR2_9AGAR|nr:hypothetical protein CPB83DRAFT_882018 [Crepidotus variabilis]